MAAFMKLVKLKVKNNRKISRYGGNAFENINKDIDYLIVGKNPDKTIVGEGLKTIFQ